MNTVFETNVDYARDTQAFAQLHATPIGKLFDDVQAMAELQYANAEPRDSMPAQLYVMTPEMRDGRPLVGIVELRFINDADKQFVARVYIPSVLTKHAAIAAATLIEAWMVNLEKEQITSDWRAQINAMPRPSQHPDRIEIVILQVFDNLGNILEAVARIERSADQPPRLGKWTQRAVLAGNPQTNSRGQFVDPIRDTLIMIRESTAGGRG